MIIFQVQVTGIIAIYVYYLKIFSGSGGILLVIYLFIFICFVKKKKPT